MAEWESNDLIYWRKETHWWDTKEWPGGPDSNALPYAFKKHPFSGWCLAGRGTYDLPTRQFATEKEAKEALTAVVVRMRLTNGG